MKLEKDGAPALRRTLVVDGSVNNKIDARLAAQFARDPKAVVSGFVRSKRKGTELVAFVGVRGFRVNDIAGDIHTFHGATKAAVEKLAAHRDVVFIEGAVQHQLASDK